MTDVFAKVALGPLLLAQGLYTRWVTPRLPEAEGPRQGRHADASGPALRLSRIALATEAGVAISLPPFYAVTRLLREESVVRLLGNHQLRQRNVYALYPSRRFLDAKVKTWVDFLKVELPQFLAEQESVVNDSRHWQ
ncbi:LysR substrate-binding domain-containing protein [Pseudomonas sp. S1Bt23]|uniref:LysR substrate-binding domain-containing protein n=1 Tax=Pseudomonas sp. S1Bt23 TaxID=3095074 RepID=UPI002A5B0A48|nr:LysR substrate-binding domain-containing protein [Pseudomonas sp. S1Bt23]WPO48598.1 LysR substrate-binding domain-containing protein [Pseudomonas sp. S1Bt23]